MRKWHFYPAKVALSPRESGTFAKPLRRAFITNTKTTYTMMPKFLIPSLLLLVCTAASAQTDAYIKIHDSHGRHPRAVSVAFPGDTPFPADYDALYGHGAVLENPWLAIRVYMDARQSVDLYLKHRPGLELDSTGFYSTAEQVAAGTGCDVLFAGKSVSLGAFRGWHGEPCTIDTVRTRQQRVVDDHTIEVRDIDWTYNGHTIQMTQTYTAHPDRREIDVEVRLAGWHPGDLFATGVQKIERKNQGFLDPAGRAASWGENTPDKALPEWTETVGLAIRVCADNIAASKEDDLNYLFLLRPDAEGRIRYTISATGLREAEGYKTAKEWFAHVRD